MEHNIRNLIDGVYDIQKLRIATGNRVVAALRGIIEDTGNTPKTEAQREKEQKEKDSILKKILGEYKNITEAYVEIYKGTGSIVRAISNRGGMFIKTKVDYTLVEQYMKLRDAEDGLVGVVAAEVKQHPMWSAFFNNVQGCGPMVAAVCLAYLDPYKARHASSFWKYCGLDVVLDTEKGEMRGNGRWHTEMRPYITKQGEEAEKKSLTFNPFVKTKLVEVFVGSVLKAHGLAVAAAKKANRPEPAMSGYAKIYWDYRNRRIQMGDTPIQQHRRAARYCAKMFLRDMWVAWRTLEGLPVSEPYEVAKLGHKPHGT